MEKYSVLKAFKLADGTYSTVVFCLSLTFVLLLFSTVNFAQTSATNQKIDPVFQRLIAENNIIFKSTRKNNKKKVKPCKASATNKDSGKKYDCIIYTRKPKALAKTGIIMNSALPTFVTASASLYQILQLASIREVTAIIAPTKLHKLAP